MPAGRGNRHRPLGHFLAADVGEIEIVDRELLKPFLKPRRCRVDVQLAGEEGNRLGKRRDADHLDPFDDRRLRRARFRHDQPAQFLLRRAGHRHRERAAGRPRAAVERQLAEHGILLEAVGGQLPAAGQQAQRDRQIE
jgi:hypothetical protein